MFKLLKMVGRVGEVTVKYPNAPLDLPNGFRGKPQYDADKCIACAACTTACPPNALTMETDVETGTRTWQLFVGRCIFCGRCEEVCPTHALVLSDQFELTVFNKADLYERAVFKLAHCRECGEAFAPQKEIDYAMDLLAQSGVGHEVVEARRQQFETCPACKRYQNIVDKTNIDIGKFLGLESEK